MSALTDVLTWSADAPAWIRDALRRIVSQPEVTPSDIDEFVELCKKAHGLSDTAADPVPLTKDHLPSNGEDTSVSIVSLTHVSDVNALAPGETLSFEKTGLNVIYGDNGAGKSGYARILKRACRARGSSDPVLANALSEQPGRTPTAKLKADAGGVETEHRWKDGSPCADELAAVSVFDTSAAQVYVADKTEVRFRPFGLDVLDKLADACTKVKTRLDQERSALANQTARWPAMPSGTAAGDLLAGVTALTPREDVKRLATLTDEETRELKLLADALAAASVEDPARRAADHHRKAQRLTRLAERLQALGMELGPAAVESLTHTQRDAKDAEQKAKELAATFESHARLPGFGSSAWRTLWDAACQYSEQEAYREHAFPHVGHDAACVLCQQDLDERARTRLARFEEFVGAKAQQAARSASAAARSSMEHLAQLDLGDEHADARSELAALDPDLGMKVDAFLDACRACRDALLNPEGPSVGLQLAPPVEQLKQFVTDLERRAAELKKAANPEERRRQEKRHAELHARSILASIEEDVYAEITRLARINAYERCTRDTRTARLTRLSTELTKTYVTGVLTAGFSEELGSIGFDTIELELGPAGGSRGNLYHQVRLKHTTRAQLPRVVSEGEARCIALAAFMAEIRSAGHTSAIVFDDPVSSLDQRWRARVAGRLVEEAKSRQVIVFTHELVFLAALTQAAQNADVPCHTQSVWRRPDTAGHVDTDLPFAVTTTKNRIGWLKNEWQRADKIYRVEGQQAYDPVATRIYARLRQAWERAIEEILLNGVVVRFRPSVETQRLRQLKEIQSADLDAIEHGMTKCSRWEGGHDTAIAAYEPVPAPDELAKDIDHLEQWVKSLKTRRK